MENENKIKNENEVQGKTRRKKGSKELNNREKDILKYIEKQVEEKKTILPECLLVDGYNIIFLIYIR